LHSLPFLLLHSLPFLLLHSLPFLLLHSLPFLLLHSNQAPLHRPARSCTAHVSQVQPPDRNQLLPKSSGLQSRLGKRHCDESELLPLLFSHGHGGVMVMGRVRTSGVSVHPLAGWRNFKVALDSAKPSVGEANAEIACVQETEEARQELHNVVVRADGGAVREDDADAELLGGDDMLLGGGEVVAMAVTELPPLVWRTFAEVSVALGEEGAVAAEMEGDISSLGDIFFVENFGSRADGGQALLGSRAPDRGNGLHLYRHHQTQP
jgi:hypothetical protein